MTLIHARRAFAVAAVTLLAGCGSGGDSSQAPSSGSGSGFNAADYFMGKTIHLIVTSSPGGNTDMFGRFMASKMADEIPGRPRIAVTENKDFLLGLREKYVALWQ